MVVVVQLPAPETEVTSSKMAATLSSSTTATGQKSSPYTIDYD